MDSRAALRRVCHVADRAQGAAEAARASTRLGLKAISRLSGITRPALALRLRHGELPPPMGVRPSGRPYWSRADIERWIEESPLPGCPYCGVKLKRLDIHLVRKHPQVPRDGQVVDDWNQALDRAMPRASTPTPSTGSTTPDGGAPDGAGDPTRPSWLTVAAAAAELAVGELVVRNLIGAGEMAARQGVDGRWRIDRHDFEAWIRVQYARTRNPPTRPETAGDTLAVGP